MPQLDGATIGVIGTIVGTIIGVSATVIVFFLQKNKTLLQYVISTTPLVTEKMAVILNDRMSIDGQPVKSMSSTTISFINSGNQRIKSSDFSEQEPLRIILKGHLYGYDVSLGNQKLLPKVNPADDNVLKISFENLKSKQFFSVTILHDETLDVFGELTTGTMRQYRPSITLLCFLTIFWLGCLVMLVDVIVGGYVSTLIGEIGATILCLTLFFAMIVTWAIDIYKSKKHKTLFNTLM